MPTPLHIELLRHQLIRDRLLVAYPDLDQETLLDTLEGVSDLKEMLAATSLRHPSSRPARCRQRSRLVDRAKG